MTKLSELSLISLAIRENRDLSHILVPGTLRGIKVYQNNYLYGHIEVLKNKYTSILRILGDENFNYFSKKYIERFYPQKENIDEYGELFSDFLNEQDELENLKYLKYLAELDLLWFEIYERLEEKFEFPAGVFSLWSAIINDDEIKNIEISMNKVETITSMQNGEDDVFLVLSI